MGDSWAEVSWRTPWLVGRKQNLRAVSVSPQVLETLNVNHCLQCSGPHPTFQKCLGKACPDASTHRQGRVTGRNIFPTPTPPPTTASQLQEMGWRTGNRSMQACLPPLPSRHSPGRWERPQFQGHIVSKWSRSLERIQPRPPFYK